MQFWTKDEYLKFIDAIMDKPLSFYAFGIHDIRHPYVKATT